MNTERADTTTMAGEDDVSPTRFAQSQKLERFNIKIKASNAEGATEMLIQTCLHLTGAGSGKVYIREGEKLVKMASVGECSALSHPWILLSEDQVPCVWVVNSKESYVANHAQDDEYIKQGKSKAGDAADRQVMERLGSYASYPLELGGEIVGVLDLQSEKEGFFTDEVCALVEEISPIAAMVLENARLHKEIDNLQTLLDILPDYIFVKDCESRFLFSNAAHLSALGVATQDELVGKTDLDIFPEVLAKQYYADEQKVIQSKECLASREESTLHQTTGETQWLLTTKIPLQDDHGRIVGIVGIARDITQLKKAREELRKMMEETFGDTGDRFAGHLFHRRIAHDVKNVLAVILTNLGELSGYPSITKMSNNRQRRLSDLVKRVVQSSDTIETFLEVAKEPALKQDFFDVNRILKQTISLLQVRIDSCAIEIDDSGLVEDLPEVYVNSIELIMVLFNLISNAVDALSKVDRPRKLELRTRMSKDKRWIELIIEDNGCGMTHGEQTRLFEPYFSTKGRKGLGLGLFGSKLIVEKYDGSIALQSRLGKGSTFTLLLPKTKKLLEGGRRPI